MIKQHFASSSTTDNISVLLSSNYTNTLTQPTTSQIVIHLNSWTFCVESQNCNQNRFFFPETCRLSLTKKWVTGRDQIWKEITNDNWQRRHNNIWCDDKNVINNFFFTLRASINSEFPFPLIKISCNNFSPSKFSVHYNNNNGVKIELWWWQILPSSDSHPTNVI